jgi:hypothetical protein
MANDDLLQQFKKLLEENNKQLRQEIREDNKADIRAEVDPLHERMDTQYKNLSGQIAQQGEQIAKVEKNIIEQFSPITNMVLDHDEKIEALEKAVELHSKH